MRGEQGGGTGGGRFASLKKQASAVLLDTTIKTMAPEWRARARALVDSVRGVSRDRTGSVS